MNDTTSDLTSLLCKLLSVSKYIIVERNATSNIMKKNDKTN